ncbi:MAG TPA: C4-type zinc ribbon domain-containing protein [Vicinamibacterales bacterium]
MNPDIQHLIRLQHLDSEIESARRRIAEIPAVQEALVTRLAQAAAAVETARQRLAASQHERKTIENEVAAIQIRLSKYKGQLTELKTNKEYQTMQHEIATAEQAIRSLEDRVLERMEEAEALTGELKAAEAELKTQQAAIAAERKTLEAEASALQRAADEKSSARVAAAKELSPAALKLFEHVSKQRKGLAVAEARDGGCTVCHVRMRPQMFNEVRRGENLIQCESCLRILYFLPDAATQAS